MRETKSATSPTKKRHKPPIHRKISVVIRYLDTDTSRFAQLVQKYKLLKTLLVVILLMAGLVTLPIWLPALMGFALKDMLDTPLKEATPAKEPKTNLSIPMFFVIGIGLAMIVAALSSGASLLEAWLTEELCFRPSRHAGVVCFDMNTEPVSFILWVFFFYIVFWFSVFFVTATVIKLSREGSSTTWR